MTKPQPLAGKVIGVWAYVKSSADHFGGVETQVARLCAELRRLGASIVLHCLSSARAGWHVADGQFRQGPSCDMQSETFSVFHPQNGPGLEGCVSENVAVAGRLHEEVILAFGTRDGHVFDIAREGSNVLGIPLVSFIYFTAEERQYRSQFHNRTRSIPGVASTAERADLIDHSLQVIVDTVAASELVVVPTMYVRDQVVNIAQDAMEKCRVIYHGVDDDFVIQRNCCPPRRGWLHVSRVSLPYAGHKNFFWSLEATRAASRLDPAVMLKVIGAGDAGDLLQQFVIANDLQDSVSLAGTLSPRRVAAEFARSKILLVPSMMEAGSTTTVEAVLSGCLPVGASAAALPELFGDLGLAEFLLPTRIVERGDVSAIEPDLDLAVGRLIDWDRRFDDLSDVISEAGLIARERFHVRKTTGDLIEAMDGAGLI